jgi:hypothetical protein
MYNFTIPKKNQGVYFLRLPSITGTAIIPLYGLRKTCEFLEISTSKLYNMIDRKKIIAFDINFIPMIPQFEILRYIFKVKKNNQLPAYEITTEKQDRIRSLTLERIEDLIEVCGKISIEKTDLTIEDTIKQKINENSPSIFPIKFLISEGFAISYEDAVIERDGKIGGTKSLTKEKNIIQFYPSGNSINAGYYKIFGSCVNDETFNEIKKTFFKDAKNIYEKYFKDA